MRAHYIAVYLQELKFHCFFIYSNAEVGEGAFGFSSRSAGRIGAVIEYRRSTTSTRQQKAHSILTSSQSVSIRTQLEQSGKYSPPSTRHFSEPYSQSQPEDVQKRRSFPTVIRNEYLVNSKQAHNKAKPVRSSRDPLPTPPEQPPPIPKPRRLPVQLPQLNETTTPEESPPKPMPRRPPAQSLQQDKITSPEAQPSHYQTLIETFTSPPVDAKLASSTLSPVPRCRRVESANNKTLESNSELEEKQSKESIYTDLEDVDAWVGKHYSRAPNFQSGSKSNPDLNHTIPSSNRLASSAAKHSSRPSSMAKKPDLQLTANNKGTLPSHLTSPISPYATIQKTSDQYEDPYCLILEPPTSIDSRPPAHLPNETSKDEIDHSGHDDEPEYEYISMRKLFQPEACLQYIYH